MDDARGIYLRWRAYPPDHETHANRYVIDLVAAGSGVTFHRFEGGFNQEVALSSPDTPPLPETKPMTILGGSSPRTSFYLLRATEPVPEGTAVSRWWRISAQGLLG